MGVPGTPSSHPAESSRAGVDGRSTPPQLACITFLSPRWGAFRDIFNHKATLQPSPHTRIDREACPRDWRQEVTGESLLATPITSGTPTCIQIVIPRQLASKQEVTGVIHRQVSRFADGPLQTFRSMHRGPTPKRPCMKRLIGSFLSQCS